MQHRKISESHYTILRNDAIQDGLDRLWNSTLCAQLLRNAIQEKAIREVYSFDAKGVSKHPNHIATFLALRHLSQDPDMASVSFYSLDSVPLVVKYVGPLSLIGKRSGCIYNSNPLLSLHAFRVYESQFTWYRVLFSLLSRYSYANCWNPVVVPPS